MRPSAPTPDTDRWSAVWSLARSQGGVITRAQVYALGISERTVSRRVVSGEWRAFGKHVLVHALAPDDAVTRGLAAAHAVGVSASVLTGPTAVAVRGLQSEPPWDALEPPAEPWIITARHVDLPGRVRVLRAAPPRGDRIFGVEVASPDRVLLDLLRLLPERQSRTLGFRALQASDPLRLQNLLRDAVERNVGHTGVARLRSLLEAATVNVHSDGEVRMASLLRSAGIAGWRANEKVRVAGRNYQADFLFPRASLVIEVDGRAWHGVDRMDIDHARQNALLSAGYRVMRFSWWRIVHDPVVVVAEIRAALGVAA